MPLTIIAPNNSNTTLVDNQISTLLKSPILTKSNHKIIQMHRKSITDLIEVKLYYITRQTFVYL